MLHKKRLQHAPGLWPWSLQILLKNLQLMWSKNLARKQSPMTKLRHFTFHEHRNHHVWMEWSRDTPQNATSQWKGGARRFKSSQILVPTINSALNGQNPKSNTNAFVWEPDSSCYTLNSNKKVSRCPGVPTLHRGAFYTFKEFIVSGCLYQLSIIVLRGVYPSIIYGCWTKNRGKTPKMEWWK